MNKIMVIDEGHYDATDGKGPVFVPLGTKGVILSHAPVYDRHVVLLAGINRNVLMHSGNYLSV